jgi:hypothetical protein
MGKKIYGNPNVTKISKKKYQVQILFQTQFQKYQLNISKVQRSCKLSCKSAKVVQTQSFKSAKVVQTQSFKSAKVVATQDFTSADVSIESFKTTKLLVCKSSLYC